MQASPMPKELTDFLGSPAAETGDVERPGAIPASSLAMPQKSPMPAELTAVLSEPATPAPMPAELQLELAGAPVAKIDTSGLEDETEPEKAFLPDWDTVKGAFTKANDAFFGSQERFARAFVPVVKGDVAKDVDPRSIATRAGASLAAHLRTFPDTLSIALGNEMQTWGKPGEDLGNVVGEKLYEFINQEYFGNKKPMPEAAKAALEQVLNLIPMRGAEQLAKRSVRSVIDSTLQGTFGKQANLEDLGGVLAQSNVKEYKTEMGRLEASIGKPQGLLEMGVDSGMASLPTSAASAFAGGLGGMGPALSTMYALSNAQKQAERVVEGDRPDVAAASGALEGLMEAVPESWSLKELFKTGSPFFKRTARFLVKEIGTENLSQAMEDVKDHIFHNPDQSGEDFARNFLTNQIVTPISTLFTGGAMVAGQTAGRLTAEGIGAAKQQIEKVRKEQFEKANPPLNPYSDISALTEANEKLRIHQELYDAVMEQLRQSEEEMQQAANAGFAKITAPGIEEDSLSYGNTWDLENYLGTKLKLPVSGVLDSLSFGDVYVFEDQEAKDMEQFLASEKAAKSKSDHNELRQRLEDRREAKNQLLRLLEEMRKYTPVPAAFIVSFSGERKANGTNFGGIHKGLPIQTININLNNLIAKRSAAKGPGRYESKKLYRQRSAETLAHEYGHAIFRHFWNRLTDTEKGVLQQSYREMLHRVLQEGNTPRSLIQHSAPPTAANLMMGKRVKEDAALAGNPEANLGAKAFSPGSQYEPNVMATNNPNMFTLQEYLANQVARHFLKKYSASVDFRLGPMANALRRLWYRTRKEWDPHEKFSVFMRNMTLGQEAFDAHQKLEELKLERKRIIEGFKANPPEVVVHNYFLKLEKDFGKAEPADAPASFTGTGGTADVVDRFNKLIRWTAGLLHLADLNPHIPGFTQIVPGIQETYVQASERMWNTKNAWTAKGIEITRDWIDKIPADRMGVLDDALFEADAMSDNVGRQLNQAELTALAQKHNLTQEELDIMNRIWGLFREAITAVETVRLAEIQAMVASIDNPNGITQQEANQRKAAAIKSFNEMRDRNYMPHNRFGKYTIAIRANRAMNFEGRSYKPGELVLYETHENEATRDKIADDYEAFFNPQDIDTVRRGELSEFTEAFQGFPPNLIRELTQGLNLTPDQDEALQELLIKKSPAASFQKQFLKRKNVKGYSQHSTRVFSHYFTRFSNHIARMETRKALDDAIKATQDSIKGLKYQGKRQQILDWIRRHREYLLNPGNELANLRAAGAIVHLGLIPKSAFVNLTQVPLVLYPHLAAQYGDAAAVREIAKATNAFFKFLKGGSNALSPELQTAIQIAIKRGKVDQSALTELAALSEGSFFQRGTNMFWETSDKTALRIFKAQEYAMLMFQAAEKMNRYITLISSYTLARQGGASEAEATRKAIASIDRAMLDYSRYNRPELLRGKKSAFFLFYNFMIGMGYFLALDAGWWRYLVMMLLLGGYQALPGAEMALDITDFAMRKLAPLAGWDNPVKQSRVAIRDLMNSIHARTNGWWPEADLAAHGIGRYLGPFDISASLSMGRPLPITQYLNSSESFAQYVKDTGSALAGALVAIPMQVINAIGSDDPSVWKQVELGLPGQLKNLSRAARWGVWGYETDSNGAKLVYPGTDIVIDFHTPRGAIEIAGQALGFAPSRVNEAKEAAWAARQAQMLYTQRRAILFEAYWKMRQSNSDKDWEEFQQRKANFNERCPYPDLRITNKDLQNSYKGRVSRQQRKEWGYAETKKGNALFQETIRDFAPSSDIPAPAESPSDTRSVPR